MPNVRGMSLTELLIVFAILAILGAYALPKYGDYQREARRMDAKSALEQIAVNQESFYITNHQFTTDLSNLGYTAGLSKSGHYAISVSAATPEGFQVTAVPAPGSPQGGDEDCLQFTIDNNGLRSATPDPKGDCW